MNIDNLNIDYLRTIDYLSTIQPISTLQFISTQTNLSIITSLYLSNTNMLLLTTSTISTLSNQSTIYKLNTQSTINYLSTNINSTTRGFRNLITYDRSTITYILSNINYNNTVSTNNSVWINNIIYYSTTFVNILNASTQTKLIELSNQYITASNNFYPRVGTTASIGQFGSFIFINNYTNPQPELLAQSAQLQNKYYISTILLSTNIGNNNKTILELNKNVQPYKYGDLSTLKYFSSLLSTHANVSSININQYLSTVSSLLYNNNLVSLYNFSTINYINTSSLNFRSTTASTIRYISSYISTFNYSDMSTIMSLSNLSTSIGRFKIIDLSTLLSPVLLNDLPSSLINTFQRVRTLYPIQFGLLSSSTCNYLPLIGSNIIKYNDLVSSYNLINNLLSLSYPIFSSTLNYTVKYHGPYPVSPPYPTGTLYANLVNSYWTVYTSTNIFFNNTQSLMVNVIPPYLAASTVTGISTNRGFSTINGFSSIYGYSTIGGIATNKLFSSINGFSTFNTLQILSTFSSLQKSISNYIGSDIINITKLINSLQSTINAVII
jgi:hypothetical protein